jgi:hypothetical protein
MIPSPFRVLVTGSRSWLWPLTVFDALDGMLREHGDRLVIVHGACSRGADAMADAWCTRRGVRVERHPADWSQGKHAGHLRNLMMVTTSPAVCLAFIHDGSPGASHCAALAESWDVPTLRFER